MDTGRRAPLSVLFVTTDVGLGGAERQVELLARELLRRGHPVRWATLQDVGRFEDELDLSGLDVVGLGMRRGVPDPRAVVRLAREMRRFRPDVLHSHMVHANLLARVARLLAWVPVQVSTAHSVNEGARWREFAYRATDALCDLTTQVCEMGARRFVAVGAVPARKLRSVPNGVDFEALATVARDGAARARVRAALGLGAGEGEGAGGFLWLAVGRLEPAKDYPTLLEAVRRMGAHGSGMTVAIAGYGSERDALERALQGLDPAGARVRLLGARRDVPALLAAADGYVLSSRLEGMPVALLEAASAGLPIVATDVGGVGQIVRSGEGGVVVTPGDAAALAAAMLRVAQLPVEERRAMGRRVRETARSVYAIEVVVDRWLELYRELLGEARLRPPRRPPRPTRAPSS